MKKQILILAAVLFLSLFGGAGGGLFAQALPGAGNALSFDGVDDYVQCASLSPAVNGNLTVSFWFMANQNPPGQERFLDLAQLAGRGLQVCVSTAGEIMIDNTGIGIPEIRSSPGFCDGRWHHVAATRIGTSYNLFVDGIFVGSNTGTAPTFSRVFIGVLSELWGYFPGQIDEVRIWNTAHTQTEIRNTMCQKLAGTEAGLVGYWRFDETSGTTAVDSSPNGNNGTLW